MSAAYTGELETEVSLRYKRQSAISGKSKLVHVLYVLHVHQLLFSFSNSYSSIIELLNLLIK